MKESDLIIKINPNQLKAFVLTYNFQQLIKN